MLSGKVRTMLSLVFLAALIFTSTAQAGLACRLEKEVPRYEITGIAPITAMIFDSQAAAAPVAEQNFRPQELMAAQYLGTRGGAIIYRVRMDFTNTDLLTRDMDLWWEIWIGGKRIGEREKVPQSAFAIFAAEAAIAGDANLLDGLDSTDFTLDAELVTQVAVLQAQIAALQSQITANDADIAANTALANGHINNTGNAHSHDSRYVRHSGSSLRVVSGRVYDDGSIATGSQGFTVTKSGTGVYRINYTSPFSAWAVPVITPLNPALVDWSTIGSSGVTFTLRNTSGTAIDEDFSFAAFGL